VTPDGVDPDLNPELCRHFELVYWAKVSPLTSPGSYNTILTNYPSCYLYGSLVAAEPFIANDARMALWKGQYEEALDRATHGDRADTLASLQISLPLENPP
jgi:hypothetical protein